MNRPRKSPDKKDVIKNRFNIDDMSTSKEELDSIQIDYRVIADLLGSKDEFLDIGLESSVCTTEDEFDIKKMDDKLEDIQYEIFRSPTFVIERKKQIKQEHIDRENLRIKNKALEQEEIAKEAEKRASVFQFDFGYLDAEVHELIEQLDSVYPNVCPMPDTSTTKSLYTTTKDNIQKLGLKVILNRLCIVGEYTIPGLISSQSQDSSSEKAQESDTIQKHFISELARLRSRTDSVFSSELGPITGCLLSYPKYFIAMIEGPELSIMDLLNQAEKLFKKCVNSGRVLFVAAHVMTRYLKDWVDVTSDPPATQKKMKNQEGSSEQAKQKLINLCDSCQNLWKIVALDKKKGRNLTSVKDPALPQELLIQFAINCDLLRPLDTWLKQTLKLTYGDFTSDSWPQIWYPLPLSAYANDSQIDSLGVLDTYGDIGLDKKLIDFLTAKISWKPNEHHQENVDDVQLNQGQGK